MIKNPPADAGDARDACSILELGRSTPVFLPGESHGQRSLAGYSSWVCKESDTTQQQSACACIHTRAHTHTHTHTHKHTLFIVNEVKPKTLHGIL